MTDWHSPTSIRQSLLTYRSRLHKRNTTLSIAEQQKLITEDVPYTLPTWISKFNIVGPPEDDVLKLLCKTIDHHSDGHGKYEKPSIGRLEGHWVGNSRSDAIAGLEKRLLEKKRCTAMRSQASRGLVTFWVGGGGFYLNGPTQYYKPLTRLAKLTEGRVFLVRQRLAPSYPFPAALLDVLHGYLSLIAPPPSAVHQAIPVSDIVLAGDGTGACLALGLLQVLLTIQRESWVSEITFYGKTIPVPGLLPAGFVAFSPVADLAGGLPSWRANAEWDVMGEEGEEGGLEKVRLYCEAGTLANPIVSPALAGSWRGGPPMWVASGSEMVGDGVRMLCQMAAREGVSVRYTGFEQMPHSFVFEYGDSWQSQRAWTECADAIVGMAEGKTAESKAVLVKIDEREEKLDGRELVGLSLEEARKMSKEAAANLQAPKHGESKVERSKL